MCLLFSRIFLVVVKVLAAAHKALYDLPFPPVPVLASSTPPSPSAPWLQPPAPAPASRGASRAPGRADPGRLHVLFLCLGRLHG